MDVVAGAPGRSLPLTAPGDPSARRIFAFWAPLAATWLMMAVEGPYLAAVVARLPDPTLGLAAYGVAIALAVLMEAPVIMLLSASTALVEDAVSYRRLRTFAHGLNAFSTLMLLVVLVPPVHRGLMLGVLGLPEELARLTYGALWCFLPWPAAIGYRRFWQGVLIRSGRTRLVAGGTVVRLVSMSVAALAFAIATDLPGAAVGASALSFGVVMEAAVARWMARDAIRALLVPAGRRADAADPVTVSSDPHDIAEIGRVGVSTADPASGAGTEGGELSFGEIGRFYVPLMLTSLIGIAIQPMLTFFMGRAASPVESLAVFPVVHSLGFIFRSVGLSFQDAVIALLGRRNEGYEEIRRFAIGLGATLSGILALLAFTPLSHLWFVHVSGLTPELASFAIPAARVLTPVPFLGVLLSLQRGTLIRHRTTGPIIVGTAAEITAVAIVFVAVGWGLGWVGATAAFTGFLLGRLTANIYLTPKVRAARHEAGSAIEEVRR
ncbi:MAG: hypothetical protein F4164_06885 [Gemmatimonadales bacterium]|nr:hypothetical protein [Gemmatimonadales bacterium]MYG49083.1 hypothetical protein [Gemmatimonadales bacterium]MYK02450.1 hypothetical protein [Candidatus Palauibacter ramosifaciens]